MRGAIAAAVAGALLPFAVIFSVWSYHDWVVAHRSAASTIAFIPSTTADDIWEPAHFGAMKAARSSSYQIYWNGPTFPEDTTTQIRLLQKAVASHVRGVILAPVQAHALMEPVQQALNQGTHLVVIGETLPLPPSPSLHYLLNDEEAAGRLLARRLNQVLDGNGMVGLIGVDPASPALFLRTQAMQTELGRIAPQIHIIALRSGANSDLEAGQRTRELLRGTQPLQAIVALTSNATAGAFRAMDEIAVTGRPLLLGAGQDYASLYRLSQGTIDSLLVENTYGMGMDGTRLLLDDVHTTDAPVLLPPTLVTRDNMLEPRLTPILTHLGGAGL